MPLNRKIIRLAPSRYLGRNTYFLTFCCEGRRHIFADSAHAASIVSALKTVSESTLFLVHAYCVMPDHFHSVLEGARDDSDLEKFAKTFKQITSFHHKKSSSERLWQKAFYDHILRASDSLDAVLCYVWLNPVRASLCADPRSYPYSGSFTLDWSGSARNVSAWMPPWKDSTKNEIKRAT